MKYPVTLIATLSVGCTPAFFGHGGEEVVYRRDVSGESRVEFDCFLSAAGRTTFQQLRVAVVGQKMDELGANNLIVVEAYAENTGSAYPIQFSQNDFIKSEFSVVELDNGEESRIHRGILRRPSGGDYFDVRVSHLKWETMPVKIKIKFSKPMPAGTAILIKVMWADGP
jgi:hypothetical protein